MVETSEIITGTLIQSYFICRRQLWLMSRQLIPDQEHPYLEIGRLIDESSYARERKKINFENVVLDFIRSEDGQELVVGEVKKSSRAEKSAKMQLAYYLYRLKEAGIRAKGILSFPQERKRQTVELTPEVEQALADIFAEIKQIIQLEKPPPFQKVSYCKHCGYKEFCHS
jgi:CRISPR-associated exonuclease Cas4